MRFDQVQILTAGDLSQATVTSNGIDLQQLYVASIQAVYTGSPVGTFVVQVSNDIVKIDPSVANQAANVVNWIDYSGSSLAISAAGSNMWNLTDMGYRWVRLKYTKTSGTGAVTAIFTAKGA